MTTIPDLVMTLAAKLLANGHSVAVAESCTGGLVAAACTELAGSSRWFDRGWVTYSNDAKEAELDVKHDTLATHGAVSAATVTEMVNGALHHSRATVVAAISGIAGPDGGSVDKPVGTVWIAVQKRDKTAIAKKFVFIGNRAEVRQQAVAETLQLLLEHC